MYKKYNITYGEEAEEPTMAMDQTSWPHPTVERLIRPTVWPFFTGLGITLMAFGFVTQYGVSVLGGIFFLAGVIGWVYELLHE